jgi:O-antigen/teichoic acid export membrane protein
VFWINLSAAFVIVAAFWFVAPTITSLLNIGDLDLLIRITSIGVVLSALGSVPNALLARRLEFKSMSRIGIVANGIAGLAAILAAHEGAGVWALVVQPLLSSAITTASLWRISGWRPRLRFDRMAARRLFRFGGFVFSSSVLEVVYARAYALLIGKWYGVHDLGIYGRANDLSQLPSGLMGGIVSRVLFSLFSMQGGGPDACLARMRRAVLGTMYVYVPIMLGLLAVAPLFVPAVFGSKWEASVPFLQVLCVAGVFWPLHAINLQALLGRGHSDLYFRLEVAKKVIGVAALVAGAFFGTMGVAMGQLVASLIALIINTHYSGSRLQYSLIEQLRDSGPSLLVGITMALAVSATSFVLAPFFGNASLVLLGLLIVIGGLVYSSLSWIFGLRALREMVEFAGSSRTNIQTKGQ